MKLFRAKPVTVEAIQWDGKLATAAEVKKFVEGDGSFRPITCLAEETGDGYVGSLWSGGRWNPVHVGDFVVKDGSRFTAVDEQAFLARYAAVNG